MIKELLTRKKQQSYNHTNLPKKNEFKIESYWEKKYEHHIHTTFYWLNIIEIIIISQNLTIINNNNYHIKSIYFYVVLFDKTKIKGKKPCRHNFYNVYDLNNIFIHKDNTYSVSIYGRFSWEVPKPSRLKQKYSLIVWIRRSFCV